jgi:hypothetical protein
MRRRTIAACFWVACLLVSANARAARTGQSGASSSTSSHKIAAHKRRHSKHQPPGQKAPTADRMSEIQSALARAGYYQGNPTGKLDSNTVGAIEKFQSANGLDSSGKLDAPTLQKLGLGSDIAGVSAPKPVIPSCCPSSGSSTPASSQSATNCCSAPTSSSNSSSPHPQSPAGDSASAAGAAAAPSGSKPAQQ